MHSFNDAKDEAWTIDVTVDLIDRIKAGLNVDFMEPIDGEPSPVTRFYTDPRFMVAVIYTACDEEIQRRDLKPEEFAARLNGEAIRRAHDVFMEELQAFFRCLGRLEIVEAIRGAKTIVTNTMKLAADRVKKALGSKKDLDAAIDRQLDKFVAASTGSQDSSASTRARSR